LTGAKNGNTKGGMLGIGIGPPEAHEIYTYTDNAWFVFPK